MEKAEIFDKVISFSEKVNIRTKGYQDRLHKLYEYAVSNNGLTCFYNDVLDKITNKNSNVNINIFELLECFNILSPNCSDTWLLCSNSATFLTRYEVMKENSIISRYYPEIEFAEVIRRLLINHNDFRNIMLNCIFSEDYDLDKACEELCHDDSVNLYGKYYRRFTEKDIKELFLNHYASMNRLKKIIPGFNEAWLLFDEGDMFENNIK